MSIESLLDRCAKEHWFATIISDFYRDGNVLPGHKGVGTPGFSAHVTSYWLNNVEGTTGKANAFTADAALTAAIMRLEYLLET